MNVLKFLCSFGFLRRFLRKRYTPRQSKAVTLFNITFSNPLGLGAGFDKNALFLRELEMLGFGAIEVGTITPQPQAGNPKPRLFRLTKDKALINRMGFNNDGARVIAARLHRWKNRARDPGNRIGDSQVVIGGNIGKNKNTSNQLAWKDYEVCFRELFDCVDYFVVNVSSPNTPGLRELQDKELLRQILTNLQLINQQQPQQKPLLLKIAPDLSFEQIDDVIDLALETGLAGLVIANTTIRREGLKTAPSTLAKIGAGGVSGQPLRKTSTEMLAYIFKKTKGSVPLVASGGVFTSDDLEEKLRAGASLVQVWTGFIYEGPAVVKNILDKRN